MILYHQLLLPTQVAPIENFQFPWSSDFVTLLGPLYIGNSYFAQTAH